jgi:hypothetical protein
MKPNNMLWVINNWLGVGILELGFVFHGGEGWGGRYFF